MRKIGYLIISEVVFSGFKSFYCNYIALDTFNDREIVSLVFSKNRAMQLHAFLESYLENVENYSSMIVLYKATNVLHEKSYEDLKKVFKKYPIKFVEENNFREQLLMEIDSITAEKLILYVDDMIFSHKVDYEQLLNINHNTHQLSLSRGKDLTYSSVLLKSLELPVFLEKEEGILEFSWNEIKEYSDWSYPLGVSGYLYSSREFLAMIKTLSFKAPNSLEVELQNFLFLYKDRKGLCYQDVICVCVHANLVQDEVENPTLETFSVDELLSIWNEGYKITISDFYGKPVAISQEMKYNFELR
ncbi:hypothetical protein [Flavicella sp.]|uniref:hypothetical protein n=1 Tax=Flavicella sp. TaxID=2957742 RepID=UPI00301A6627